VPLLRLSMLQLEIILRMLDEGKVGAVPSALLQPRGSVIMFAEPVTSVFVIPCTCRAMQKLD
jgi:hypothetical protein